ncbi:protein-glutamate methylesterase/protein-glutamine glutaminase [Ketobacter sp.]
MSNANIRVLIVDDSKVVQRLLNEILSSAPGIDVVGIAGDPLEARDLIKRLDPDVITLDIEMPKMDGITFLRNLMRLRPMPVVMISTLTQKGAEITLEALEIGAVDYIAKPNHDLMNNLKQITAEIVHKVKVAARANVDCFADNKRQAQPVIAGGSSLNSNRESNIDLLAIGASTGGIEAIKQVLIRLPTNMPPIVIVQHMPAGFTASFANRLNNLLDLTVLEFDQPRIKLDRNHVYIANGNRHMLVEFSQGAYFGIASDDAPVNRHKPAVDVLFSSIADHRASHSIGVLLTGMGMDGASGLGKMKREGAITVAQDEKSSVVWGMPRVAIEEGVVDKVLPLNEIGNFLSEQCLK